MPTPKNHLPQYLSFTRKERIGIIAVLFLILFFIILPFLFPFFIKSKLVDHSAFEKEIAALQIKEQDSIITYTNIDYNENNFRNNEPSSKNNYNKVPKGELFYFDPNTLTVSDWVKLGVKEKTAATIKNYIAKGGSFSKPEDIAKIWGLHADEITRLLPYVRIEIKHRNDLKKIENAPGVKAYVKTKNIIITVDINEADTSALIALPGIGSKLASRIIAFRDKLGGFYKVVQVAETFALPDSTFQKIKDKLVISNNEVKKININLATIDELKIHPYLRYNLANAIIQYRNQHGNFSSVNGIKKMVFFTDDIFDKLVPYLSVK